MCDLTSTNRNRGILEAISAPRHSLRRNPTDRDGVSASASKYDAEDDDDDFGRKVCWRSQSRWNSPWWPSDHVISISFVVSETYKSHRHTRLWWVRLSVISWWHLFWCISFLREHELFIVGCKTRSQQVHQWRSDACRRMASSDPRIKIHQVRGRNVHWLDP